MRIDVKRTTRTKPRGSVRLPVGPCLRPGAFMITTKKYIEGGVVLATKSSKVELCLHHHHPLVKLHRDVFIVLLELAKPHGTERFPISLLEIAKAMPDQKNPRRKSLQRHIRRCLCDLIGTDVRLTPDGENPIFARFTFAEGYIDHETGEGMIGIGRFLDIVRELTLVGPYVDLREYFSIKGAVGRALYCFLRSHEDFHNGEGYKTSFRKLVVNVNYDLGGRPLWRVWAEFSAAIEQLKALRLIDRCRRDKARQASEGGVVTFWGPRKKSAGEEKAKTEGATFRHPEAMKEILNRLPFADENAREIDVALGSLEEFLRPYTTSLESIVCRYAEWLERGRLSKKFVAPSVFTPGRASSSGSSSPRTGSSPGRSRRGSTGASRKSESEPRRSTTACCSKTGGDVAALQARVHFPENLYISWRRSVHFLEKSCTFPGESCR